MQHNPTAFNGAELVRMTWTKPTLTILGQATSEEIAAARSGLDGMDKLVRRLRSESRI